MRFPRVLLATSAALVALAGCSTQAANTGGSPSATVTGSQPTSGSPSATNESTSPSATAGPKPSKVLYLTFDDGPAVPYTHQLLEILAKNNAKATFFMYGGMAKPLPNLVREVADAGQAIGNHTYTHAHLTQLSDSAIRKELKSTADVIGPAMGPCMRPPYLDTDARVRRISKEAGYATIMGDLSAADWTKPSVSQLVSSLRGETRNGNIIILHDGPVNRENTVEAIRRMVPEWIKEGYALESLPACVNKPDDGIG